MKNIHVLPTDKPSRIIKGQDNVFILLDTYAPNWFEINLKTTKQNIYITSDEEIKEGDYVCASGGFRFVKTLNNDKAKTFKDDGVISKQNPSSSCHLSNYKKIILTTDQDLIKDGVQAIDDEFLEWFVKNPSCEKVEIDKAEHGMYKDDVYYKLSNKIFYKIIIPKEEAKQETLEEVAEKHSNGMFSKNGDLNAIAHTSFIYGAKWQQERMYSELSLYLQQKADEDRLKSLTSNQIRAMIEQFKKK